MTPDKAAKRNKKMNGTLHVAKRGAFAPVFVTPVLLKKMRAIERALAVANHETARRLRVTRPARDASALGRYAELAYAARHGYAVWPCLPRWLREALHGGATTRDRGVDAVGIDGGRLVLAQVKWYREGACVSGDADMKLALIAAVAQKSLRLEQPPRALLVLRRGARSSRTSPGTSAIEYVELSDDDLGLGQEPVDPAGQLGPSGPADLAGPSRAPRRSERPEGCIADFEAYRYRGKKCARESR
jgi:hypothetical protein